jgi:3'-phosphoadenosine 5'-phosphosulfate sulfotransferase (PAPS reductase)/FAD synthetase
MAKINPLADWNQNMVWVHIRMHQSAYNPLHDRNYPTIGCTHCTHNQAFRAGHLGQGMWHQRHLLNTLLNTTLVAHHNFDGATTRVDRESQAMPQKT